MQQVVFLGLWVPFQRTRIVGALGLTVQVGRPIPEVMNEEREDRLIRRILLGGATLAVGLFLATAIVVAVMISYNFNFLEWME